GFCTTGIAIVAGAAQVLWSQRELATARQQSQLHLATADNNYWHGRNLVEHWQKSLVHRLADIPGAEAIHAQMLAETIDYYQAFLQKSATDPNLASDIAAARAGLAAALASYGDTAQSLVVYQQAIDDLRRLDQQDSTLPLRMATLHNDLAVVLLRNNRALDAVTQLQSAQACLANASPSTSVASEQLETRAAIHVNLARAYQLVDDGPAEATALDEAESLYRQLLARSESSTQHPNQVLPDKQTTPAFTAQHTRSELATVLDQRALLLASTDLKTALTISQSAVAMHSENLELNPTQSQLPNDRQNLQPPLPWAQRLAASQHNYAVLLWRSGDSDQARRQFQAAIGTKQSLTERFPDRREHTLDLALSYNGLGKLESKLHNWLAAVANFEQASHSYQTLQPNLTTDNQLMLAETLSNLLQAQLQLQKTDLSDNNNNNNTQATQQQLKDLLGQIERSSLSEPETATLHRLEVGL
ncbi:MAG: tetratricopeptide repeat protein, partial [Pirellulaceae bacterium]|nr:tetratricopeptide repeat protein [Pirellulaceae bacterium]